MDPAADQPVGRSTLGAKPTRKRRGPAAGVDREPSRHINLASHRRELSAPAFANALNSDKSRRRQDPRAASYGCAT